MSGEVDQVQAQKDRKAVRAELDRVNRLRALMTTYAQADSIITARTVKTTLVNQESAEAPVWTDQMGQVVSFNVAKIGDVQTKDDYVRITGHNYHAVAHLLFTPRKGSNGKYNAIYARAGQPADGTEFFDSFIALEDPRVESMMITRAPAVKPYLESAIAEYLLAHPEMEGYSYLLVAGRKYLGEAIIDAARAKWGHGDELLAEADDIINQYRLLDLTNQMHVFSAVSLSVKYMELLRKIKPPTPPSLPHGGGDHGGCDAGNEQQQRRSAQASANVAAGKDKPKDEQTGEEGGQAPSAGGEGEGEDEGQGAGGEGGQDEQEGDESDEGDQEGNNGGQADGEGDSQRPGPGIGNQAAEHGAGTTLEELIAAIAGGNGAALQVTSDFEGYRATLKSGKLAENLPTYGGWETGAAEGSTALTNRITREWSRLVEQADPGWQYREPEGKMNVQRWTLGERDMEQLYDAWEEGNVDATSIEAVVLVDISGSMCNFQDLLSGACWTIKRSFDTIDAPCTVIAYDGNGYYIYRRDERASMTRFPSLSCVGGTNPNQALMEAYAILAASPKKKRYLLSMTDGDWWGHGARYLGGETSTTNEDLVTAISQLPSCVTHMAYFNSNIDPADFDPTDVNWNNHKVRSFIQDITLLPSIARSAVSALIAARR